MVRAKVILLCADGLSNREVARRTDLSEHTVGTWRRRFLESRLAGPIHLTRSGRPRSISDEKVAEIIRMTLDTKPDKATHWSTRSMAAMAGCSNERVSLSWRTFGLRPDRIETFQLSTDPLFVEKVRDMAGLYLSPPQNALVLCVHEKSQIQALERTTPPELDLHLVMDNYATHKTKRVRQWLARHSRWHNHFISTHSSWLNQVERFFVKITNEMIRRGSFRSVGELRSSIHRYLDAHNAYKKPVRWTATPEAILSKVKNICKKLS